MRSAELARVFAGHGHPTFVADEPLGNRMIGHRLTTQLAVRGKEWTQSSVWRSVREVKGNASLWATYDPLTKCHYENVPHC